MSVINMKYRKSLLGISNQLTRQDLDLLKFMCEQDVPKSRMERVVSGTDLFNALEERGKLSVKNLGYLADILRSIGRSNLVENYLRSDGFVIPPSSLQVLGPGGQTGSQTTLYLFRDCLVRVAQGLTSKEVNDLVFIFQPNLQISPDAVFSATQLFTLLQQRQMLTPRDMRLLYDGLCQVQRYDLASIVNEFAVKTGLRAYQGENQGMIIDHQGRTANPGQAPVQESAPAVFYGDPTRRMLGHQYQQDPHHPLPGDYIQAPPPGGYQSASRNSSSSSSLSTEQQSMSTQPSSSTTTDYPPPVNPGMAVGQWPSQPIHEPMDVVQTTSIFHPTKPALWEGHQQRVQVPPPEHNPSAEIKPFGLAFNVFEGQRPEGSIASPPPSPREVEQQKLLEDLAMKHGQLVRKEEEIGHLRVQLEEARSDKSKVYSEKLGEAEQFKQSIRVLEDMLKTKNQEVNGLMCELQHFHMQMEAMQGGQPINEKDHYRLDRNPHGICVIINNHQFHHPTDPEQAHNNRGGAEVDQKNLQLTFQYLRYKVEIYENLTHTRMMEVMLSLAQRNHADFDSFICCILTHGEQNSVHGADSIPVSLLDLTGVMKMCTTLINKPKMFFIQACRGDREDEGHKLDNEDAVQRDSGGRQPPSTHTIPQEADFFFGYATPLGNAAYRSRRHGSWYISELCKVLTKHAYTSNLSNMMRKVNDNICRAFTKEGYKQTSEFVDRLRKEVHFFHFSKVQQQQQV